MADLQRIGTDYDPVDQQLQDPLPLGQGRLVEPRPHPLAERRQLRPDLPRRLAFGAQPLLLLTLYRKDMSPYANLFATLLELVDLDGLRLVGIEQALLLAIESTQLRLALLARRVRGGVDRVGLSGPLLELGGQCRRVVEQPPDMAPDDRVELLRPGPGLRAAARTVACDGVL